MWNLLCWGRTARGYHRVVRLGAVWLSKAQSTKSPFEHVVLSTLWLPFLALRLKVEWQKFEVRHFISFFCNMQTLLRNLFSCEQYSCAWPFWFRTCVVWCFMYKCWYYVCQQPTKFVRICSALWWTQKQWPMCHLYFLFLFCLPFYKSASFSVLASCARIKRAEAFFEVRSVSKTLKRKVLSFARCQRVRIFRLQSLHHKRNSLLFSTHDGWARYCVLVTVYWTEIQ